MFRQQCADRDQEDEKRGSRRHSAPLTDAKQREYCSFLDRCSGTSGTDAASQVEF
jgi:hypothetical protein